MVKRILTVAVLGAALIGNTGCGSGEFKKTYGVEYKIIKDAKGKNAQIGDYLEVNVKVSVDTGAQNSTYVLADSRRDAHKPVPMPVDSPAYRGDFKAALTKLSVGDSAIIRVSCDTIKKALPGQHMPEWMKSGKFITFQISVVSLKSKEDYMKEMQSKQEEMQKEMMAKSAQQMPIDDKMLQDYFAQNHIKAEKTASGLYYAIQKPGGGAAIAAGQNVSLKYIGTTLTGKVFDANIGPEAKHTDLLNVKAGLHQMIPGFDEGLMLLKKGAKATFYLPSPLAYGPRPAGPDVPANSILIFNVEVVDVTTGPAPKAGGDDQQQQGQ